MPAEGTVAAAFAAASLEIDSSTSTETDVSSDTPVVAEPIADESYTIKVDGQERSVNRDELVRLAQQGDDYTRKTQALAADRQRLSAAETLLNQLRDDPQGTLAQLAEHYQIDGVNFEDLDPEDQRYVEMDRRVAAFEENDRQQRIAQTIANLKTEFGEFNEMDVVNHAIEMGTVDLRAAYRDMTYDTVLAEARAVREAAAAEADATAVEAKRQAQIVEGGSASTNSAAPVTTGKRSISDLLREALSAA